MGLTGSPKTSVSNHSTPHNNQEDGRIQTQSYFNINTTSCLTFTHFHNALHSRTFLQSPVTPLLSETHTATPRSSHIYSLESTISISPQLGTSLVNTLAYPQFNLSHRHCFPLTAQLMCFFAIYDNFLRNMWFACPSDHYGLCGTISCFINSSYHGLNHRHGAIRLFS
jgi:hypothetical protein